jgi:hypothetical protein
MIGRLAALFYGVASYLVFFVSFVYAVAFIGNLGGPKSGPRAGSAPRS